MSNHSVAGTLCLIFRSHGPNFGVGGGTPMVDESSSTPQPLRTVSKPPASGPSSPPGLPEPIPDEDGQSTTPAVASASPSPSSPAHRSLGPSCPRRPNADVQGTVFELADFLEHATDDAAWQCPIIGGGSVELVSTSTVTLRQAS